MEGSETKVCPFCAEEIKAEAIKCKFCGEFLDGTERAPIQAPRPRAQVTWEYQDFIVPLSLEDVGQFPKFGDNVDLRTFVYSGVLQDVNSVDAGARAGLWLHLSPLLLEKQREFAEEGWEPEPSRYGPDNLQLKLTSPRGSCLVMIIAIPFMLIPFFGNFVPLPKDYYVPEALIFPMRRRVPQE